MPWMDWFCHNPNGVVRGPIYCPQDCYFIGAEVFEQAGYGVVDIRLEFRDKNTYATDWTGWFCGNYHVLRGPRVAPFNYYLVGMLVQEQAGYGVVDLRLTYRELGSPSPTILLSDPFTNNPNGGVHGPISAPPGNFVTGMEVREQAGYGVVDIRLHYAP